MKTLLILRGAPGCGKSTFIQNNNLKNNTLCADDIRLAYMRSNGDDFTTISQKYNGKVWNLLHKELELRMQFGVSVVVDATHSKNEELKLYKKLADEYGYTLVCIDFSTLPIEECKRRNAGREPLRQVPNEVIDRMYNNFANNTLPEWIKVIKEDELNEYFG